MAAIYKTYTAMCVIYIVQVVNTALLTTDN